MTLKSKKLRDAITFALVMSATTALGTGTALAQDTAAKDDAATTIDTIVVTGTRIKSQTITASSPVVEISAEQFQYSGASRVEDLVNQFPQLSPAFDSFNNNPSLGYATVDLRGLGAQRTLTLVNGNRLAQGASLAIDVSIIPASLVKRVDILTGGASAVYGSDAIAGVVNFVLDTDFEGISITTGYSAFQHDNDNEYMQGLLDSRGFEYPEGNSGFDGVSKNVDIAMGGSFADGAGHAMAWVTWRENSELFQGERDYSSCALNAAGTRCGGSNTNAAGNFYFYQPDSGAGTNAHLEAGNEYVSGYGAPFNYAPINYYQRPDERYTFGTSMTLDVNEHFKPYLETLYVNKRDQLQIAPSGAFFTTLSNVPCSNPLIGTACADLGFDPDEGDLTIYVAKRNVEGGPRHQNSENSAYRMVFGAEGAINDAWSYNSSFLYGHTSSDTTGTNDFLTSRIQSALLGCPAGSFAGCQLYNVWQLGGVTPAAAQALQGTSLNKTTTELTSFNAYITGDFGWGFESAGGDNISLVVGGEWREENFDFVADSDSAAGNFAGAGAAAPAVNGKVSVNELFLESSLPILKDVGIFKALTFDVGYRYSDYNLAGSASTYKLGFTSDFGMIRARGGFNHAIRAPNILELFSPQQIGLFGGIDKCAGPTPSFTAAQCLNTGVSAARYGFVAANAAGQYNQITGGNVNLKPEIADTWTLGFVATPIEGLQVTLDYYDIKITDSIQTIGAQTILDTCALFGDPTLCSLVRRNPTGGDLYRSNNGFVINAINNFGELSFRGLDLGANYTWNLWGGRLATSIQGSYLLEQQVAPLPGVNEAATYDCVGLVNAQCQSPEWRHIANARFSKDWYTVGLRWRYFSELDYVDSFSGLPLTSDRLTCAPSANAACLGDGGFDAFNYIDLSASVQIGSFGELTLGVNNVADKEPPLTGVTLALNGNAPGGYDQAGRYFFATFNVKF